MELFSVLASDVQISFIGETFDISLNWIGKLVKLLISSGVGVGIGVILFSLILKVIVLPFDVLQRISMRKQNIQMKDNKEKMEKLQKQYANDKKMYNQKVMEMQKQNGFSVLSSCLPMILSMVIFFVAIGAFNAYSKFATVENYNAMANAYRGAVAEYAVDINAEDTEYGTEDKYSIEVRDNTGKTVKVLNIEEDQEDFYTAKTGEELTAALKQAIRNDYETQEKFDEQIKENYTYALNKKDYIKVSHKDKIIYFLIPTETVEGKTEGQLKDEAISFKGDKFYYISVERANANTAIAAYIADKEDKEAALVDYFDNLGADAAYETYYGEDGVAEKTKFLWIKNVWATDASYKHPVLSHKDFLSQLSAASCGSSCNSNGMFIIDDEKVSVGSDGELTKNNVTVTNVYEERVYNKVTAKLGEAKEQANGYFILIVLSIGTILLQQFITMRSQKEQQKYSSVDGQAASTQKMTMIIMTVMFGAFSFMYSSAFSIYMIMSNLFSLGSTVVINKLVDRAASKKEQRALQEKYNKRLPRTNDNKTGKKRK